MHDSTRMPAQCRASTARFGCANNASSSNFKMAIAPLRRALSDQRSARNGYRFVRRNCAISKQPGRAALRLADCTAPPGSPSATSHCPHRGQHAAASLCMSSRRSFQRWSLLARFPLMQNALSMFWCLARSMHRDCQRWSPVAIIAVGVPLVVQMTRMPRYPDARTAFSDRDTLRRRHATADASRRARSYPR